jgi:hypothetical protein
MKIKLNIVSVLSILAAALPSLSAHAGVSYGFDFTDSGVIPLGGSVFSVEQTVSGNPSSLESLELILRFNDSSSLSGNSSGIEGRLILGASSSSPYVEFFPVATFISGQQRTYDFTFDRAAGSPGVGFDGVSQDQTWGLVLWDNSTGVVQNHLNGWSLNIVTAVPEPTNTGLSVFALLAAFVTVAGSRPVRECVRRWRAAAER